jgi:carbamoyl-phosphate synthase small subunit
LNIIRSLLAQGCCVIRVPWDYDFFHLDFAGVVVSNGPGNPENCRPTIELVRRCLQENIPTLGICLGHQIMALAAGARTYKLKFGHRSQNQPCREVGTKRCYITSQNHGYAVETASLPTGWVEWFSNLNDRTNEGFRHSSSPFLGVQFHPEHSPGPVDTEFIFERFLELIK